MEVVEKIIGYLNPVNWFKKSEDDASLRVMHGINRVSLVMFLFCVLVMLYRYLS